MHLKYFKHLKKSMIYWDEIYWDDIAVYFDCI